MERLHIKGINSTITDQDLEQFCSKIGKVYELHRPTTLTGTERSKDFAIARVEGGERTEKLMRQLNGSLWKGCKIRISKAKEFYKDRIQREKEEASRIVPLLKPVQEQSVENSKPSRGPFLALRKAKGLRINRLTWKPLLYVNDKVFKSNEEKRGFSAKNKKIIFEEFEPYQVPPEYSETVLESIQSLATKDVSITAPSSSNPEFKKGKGVRRGFGTLMQVDCCIDESQIPSHLMDDANRTATSEDVFGEVSPEELEKEKIRSLSILNMLLKPPEKETSRLTLDEPPVKRVKSESREAVSPKTAQRNETSTMNSVFMNVKEMKNIFAQSDGVWWNDEEIKNKDLAAIVRGNVADDIIFQEAEKFGFDIRNESQKTNSKMSSIFNNTSKKFFRLFAVDEDDQPQNEVEINPPLNTHAVRENQSNENQANFILRVNYNISDILNLSQRFSTERSREDIEEEWRETRRDKLREFKKRQRDSARKEVKR